MDVTFTKIEAGIAALRLPIFPEPTRKRILEDYYVALEYIQNTWQAAKGDINWTNNILDKCQQIIDAYKIIREAILFEQLRIRLDFQLDILDNIEKYIDTLPNGNYTLTHWFGEGFPTIEEVLSNKVDIVYPYCAAFDAAIFLYEQTEQFDRALLACQAAVGYEMESKVFPEGFERKSDDLRVKCMTDAIQRVTAIERHRAGEIEPYKEGWEISISFMRSTSRSFRQALMLAKRAPRFEESEYEGQTVYQAFFSQDPRDYLEFIKLYELIKTWKSCHVFINGRLIDRKVVGKLNYCYGDRCRSGNPAFCFGASPFTANPFGCHRLQINRVNHPYWSFYVKRDDGLYQLDRESLFDRISSYAKVYQICPVFSYDDIIARFNALPDTIDANQYHALDAHFILPRLETGERYNYG